MRAERGQPGSIAARQGLVTLAIDRANRRVDRRAAASAERTVVAGPQQPLPDNLCQIPVIGPLSMYMPPWPNGQGACLRSRRLRVRISPEVSFCLCFFSLLFPSSVLPRLLVFLLSSSSIPSPSTFYLLSLLLVFLCSPLLCPLPHPLGPWPRRPRGQGQTGPLRP